MRRRSLTNSRPYENLELRANYREANPVCELGAMLRKARLILTPDDSADIHHIVGGNGRRWDLWSNLITVSRTVHQWIHAHPIDGRLICLGHKLSKGELDLEEFRRASGMHLAGWIHGLKPISAPAFVSLSALAAFTA